MASPSIVIRNCGNMAMNRLWRIEATEPFAIRTECQESTVIDVNCAHLNRASLVIEVHQHIVFAIHAEPFVKCISMKRWIGV